MWWGELYGALTAVLALAVLWKGGNDERIGLAALAGYYVWTAANYQRGAVDGAATVAGALLLVGCGVWFRRWARDWLLGGLALVGAGLVLWGWWCDRGGVDAWTFKAVRNGLYSVALGLVMVSTVRRACSTNIGER